MIELPQLIATLYIYRIGNLIFHARSFFQKKKREKMLFIYLGVVMISLTY